MNHATLRTSIVSCLCLAAGLAACSSDYSSDPVSDRYEDRSDASYRRAQSSEREWRDEKAMKYQHCDAHWYNGGGKYSTDYVAWSVSRPAERAVSNSGYSTGTAAGYRDAQGNWRDHATDSAARSPNGYWDAQGKWRTDGAVDNRAASARRDQETYPARASNDSRSTDSRTIDSRTSDSRTNDSRNLDRESKGNMTSSTGYSQNSARETSAGAAVWNENQDNRPTERMNAASANAGTDYKQGGFNANNGWNNGAQDSRMVRRDAQSISGDDLPSSVHKTMQREAMGNSLSNMSKCTVNEKTVYECETNMDGATYTILVDSDGKLLAKKRADWMATAWIGDSKK